MFPRTRTKASYLHIQLCFEGLLYSQGLGLQFLSVAWNNHSTEVIQVFIIYQIKRLEQPQPNKTPELNSVFGKVAVPVTVCPDCKIIVWL